MPYMCLYSAQIRAVCNKGMFYLPPTHEQYLNCLYSPPQGVIALWLVLIVLIMIKLCTA